jgi:C-terminal processing protease CtpA/Prc
MLETGKQALRKEELEKKDSKLDATASTFTTNKERTLTKVGINPDTPMTNSTLVKIQQKKKNVILFIVGFAVLVACLLIFLIGGKIAKTIRSSFSQSPVAVPPPPAQPPSDDTNTDSTLRTEYNTVYQKIKKTPASKQEIDNNIRELQSFIDSHQNSPNTDKYIKDAKEHIKTMQDTKELY